MKLITHGGQCCGIKTICGMGYDPDSKLAAINKPSGEVVDGSANYAAKNWFNAEAPAQTAKERLDCFIAYADSKRKKQVIEIVLAHTGCDCCTQMKWHPVLLERGFEVVTEFKNSNSGNTCRIYHRNTGRC